MKKAKKIIKKTLEWTLFVAAFAFATLMFADYFIVNFYVDTAWGVGICATLMAVYIITENIKVD